MAKKWREILEARYSKAEIEKLYREAEQELLEMDLAEMRRMANKTQVEAAELVEMTQSELSKLERREDHRLSTLRRYVEALGGELEVIARFGNKAYRLRNV